MTTPSALSTDASQLFLDAHPPLLGLGGDYGSQNSNGLTAEPVDRA